MVKYLLEVNWQRTRTSCKDIVHVSFVLTWDKYFNQMDKY